MPFCNFFSGRCWRIYPSLFSTRRFTSIQGNRLSVMAPHGVDSERKPFNDWPNDLGFESFQEQTEPVQLKVSGKIPAYAAGVLYRTWPGGHQIETLKKGTFEASHWFDGFAQMHRFVLASPQDGEYITAVSYNSRHSCNGLIEAVRKSGSF